MGNVCGGNVGNVWVGKVCNGKSVVGNVCGGKVGNVWGGSVGKLKGSYGAGVTAADPESPLAPACDWSG